MAKRRGKKRFKEERREILVIYSIVYILGIFKLGFMLISNQEMNGVGCVTMQTRSKRKGSAREQ
jgi:hypothetical protein